MTTLEQIRKQAQARFAELGFPTTRQEEWRFTNVAPIAKTRFAAAPPARGGWSRLGLEEVSFGDPGTVSLVFVNGRFSRQLSTRKLPAGIVCRPLAEAPQSERHLARYASFEQHAFAAWNTAAFSNGAYIEIPERVALSEPLHLVYLSGGGARPFATHPRTLVVAGAGSQATLVETYYGRGAQYLSNSVTEIVAGDGSALNHYKVQREDEESFHVASTQACLGRDASYSSIAFSLGGRLVRHDLKAVLSEGSHAELSGLYLAGGAQHVDNHTEIEHARPHATSLEIYKGILDGGSSAVFNGCILVLQDAQKTDSKQTNRNLLLSEDATINTKPELKIFADDVRCTHGATIGQLDPEAIFYLQSRGIAREQARGLLTLAFAREISDRVRLETLRSVLERKIWEKLDDRRN